MNYLLVLTSLALLTTCTSYSPPSYPSTGTPAKSSASVSSEPKIAVIAENLDVPWDMVWLPNGDMLVTERPGNLLKISKTGNERLSIEGVHHIGEGGLLGLALHPDFNTNNYLYLYFTTEIDGEVTNRVDRYVFKNDQLTDRVTVIDDIPGAQYHDGGGLAFGPDGFLYITTGDAGREQLAQDVNSLAGKILRVKPDGSIPEDNPFGNAIYSYGHRNPQGLAWDNEDQLWSTEHGRSGVRSGFDEVNLIEPGQNYGWPNYQGGQTASGIVRPMLHSGPTVTWAPASAAIVNNSLYFGGLRGRSLYEIDLSDLDLHIHFKNTYGRIRAVAAGPEGSLYISTSNMDGRGEPNKADDRIIKINPDQL